jgi:hypothetical protein
VGIANSTVEKPLLILTIEGPEVKHGRIEVDHLIRVLEVFQKTLRSFATELIKRNGSRFSGRQWALIAKDITLEVIGFASGSFSIKLALRRSSKDPSGALGRESLIAMVNSLRSICPDEESLENLNGDLSKPLASFAKIAPLLHNGIDQIRLTLPEDTGLTAVINEHMCRRLERFLSRKFAEFATEPPSALSDSGVSRKLTADELLNSDLVGIWRNRADIGDSSEFARELRNKAESRER